MTSAAARGEATVRLHRGLYAEDAIAEAAATFADFATFAIRTEDDHHVVEVRGIAADVQGDVVAEFCNFALANTATRRKGGHV